MDTVGKIVIDPQVYYSADDFETKAQAVAVSVRNARGIVRHRKVPSDAYTYAKQRSGTTTNRKTNGSANQDKTYFT